MGSTHSLFWTWLLLLPLSSSADLLVRDSADSEWRSQATVYRRIGEPLAIRFGSSISTERTPLRWYSITPIAGDYDNTAACVHRRDCRQAIAYRRQEIEALRGKDEVTEVDLPFLEMPGTHRLEASTTPEAREFAADGAPAALTLVVRRDDTYIGRLTELLGVPFVLWPRPLPDGRHQTDAQLGTDCVALVIYGQRRLGHQIPYMAPAALFRYTTRVPRDRDGRQPIQVGDILHFGYQTAVVFEDRPPVGVFNDEDLIIHSYYGVAEIRPFSQLPYHNSEYVVLRWPPVATTALLH